MKTVMVTGAGGFIGQHTVRGLVDKGYDVVAVDQHLWGMNEAEKYPNRKKLQADVRSSWQMDSIFQDHRPDAIIHLAAQASVPTSWKDWVQDASQNIFGTINIVKLALKHGIERIVYASSGGTVYGEPATLPVTEDTPLHPQSPYGVSKLAAEFYVRLSGISHAILRYPNVYGPGQSSKGDAGVVAIFCGRILDNQPCVIYGDGKNTRDYVYIDDILRANILALESDVDGVFNIGNNNPFSTLEVLEAISKNMNAEPVIDYQPARTGDVRHMALDATKARNLLGWDSHVSFREGIRKTVEAMTRAGQGAKSPASWAGGAGPTPAPATKA